MLVMIGILIIALLIAYRFFRRHSIERRAIAIGLALGSLFYFIGAKFWICVVIAVIIGLPLSMLFDLLWLNYESLKKESKYSTCGFIHFHKQVESVDVSDNDIFCCKYL